jgi:TP901 family phage tail tape measure protein
MADTYVINTVFKAHDQMSSTITAATSKMDKFGKQSSRSFKRATAGATRFKTVFAGALGANIVSAGLGRLRQGISGLTTEFLDFDQAITSAASKFDFERGTEQFKELSKAAREVASVTPFSAAQTGQALNFLAMAGFDATQSMASLKGVTDLAIAGEMELGQAADIASDALGALNLMSDDSTVLAGNLGRVNDVMARVAVTANTNVPMLWEALKPVASTAEGLGGSIEQLGAMFGTLASSGVKAEKAGTALRNMYLRLTSGTSEVEKVLKKYNIAIQDGNGKMRPMIDILEDVGNETKGLSDKARQAALSHLFGARAVNSASILIKAGREPLLEYQKRLEGASGAASKLARQVGESIPNKLKVMRSRLIEIGFSIIDTFNNKIPGAMNSFQEALDNIDPAEIVSNIKAIWDVVSKFKNEIELLVTAFILYKGIVIALAAKQWALNIAMAANPVGLMIVSFATLGAIMIMVYRNWDIIQTQWKKDIEGIGQWIDENITMKLENLARKFPTIAGFFGFTPRTDAEINKMYDTQYKADQPGYILGTETPKTPEWLKKEIGDQKKTEEKTSKREFEDIGAILEKYQMTSTGLSAAQMEEKRKKHYQEMFGGAKVKPETAASPQQVQIRGEFNFKNPPEGMSFEQKSPGAPQIQHNLGKN